MNFDDVDDGAPYIGQACRECGCTDDNACVTSSGACSWVEPDLCSACDVPFPALERAGFVLP